MSLTKDDLKAIETLLAPLVEHLDRIEKNRKKHDRRFDQIGKQLDRHDAYFAALSLEVSTIKLKLDDNLEPA